MGAEYKPLPSTRTPSPVDGSSSSSRGASTPSATAHAINAACWVAFWIVCSVSIIIVNKHVITFSGFNFPFCLALWHMFLATVTSRAAVMALGIPDTIREHASPALYFQVGMIGALFAATLVTGNAALRMLTVPTVQMLKVCMNCHCCFCCQLSELSCSAWITAWLTARRKAATVAAAPGCLCMHSTHLTLGHCVVLSEHPFHGRTKRPPFTKRKENPSKPAVHTTTNKQQQRTQSYQDIIYVWQAGWLAGWRAAAVNPQSAGQQLAVACPANAYLCN